MQGLGIRLGSLFVSLLVLVAAPEAADISSLDRFLPPDTVLYLAVKDVTAAKEAARKTAFYEVWDSEGMRVLRTQMDTLWKGSVVRKLKIDPLALQRAVKKDAVLAAAFRYDPTVGLPEGISFSWVLAAEDPEGEIKKILSTIKAAVFFAGTPPPGLKTFQHGGAEVLSVPLDENLEVSVATVPFDKLRTAPGVALISMGAPGLVTTSIDQGTSKDPAGFPTAEAYPSLVGFHKKGDLSLAWVDLRSIVQTIQSVMGSAQKDVDPAVLFQQLGLDNSSHFFMRNYIDHRGFLTQQILGFDGPIHGLVGFFLHAGELKAVERFTPDVDYVMDITHGPLDEGWNRLQDMVRAVGGPEAADNTAAFLRTFEMTLGFSFEKELFPSIGDEVAIGVQGERFTLLVQVLDQETLTKILPKFLQLWELKPETVKADEITYTRVEIPEAGIALFYGIDRGYLTISNSPEGYLSALKEVDKERSIMGSRRYGKALSYLPAANSFLTITDLRGMANFTSTIMKIQQAVSGSGVVPPLDLSFLAEETFPIVEVGVTQEDRYIRWSYSESGIEPFLGLYSSLNAILGQMAAEEGKRTVVRCRADLRTLMTTLESYHMDNNKYPETLDQLSGPVAYLAKIPTDPWTTKPYVYKTDGKTYILIGAGPNGKIDLDVESIEGPFTEEKIPQDAQYDPTRGDAGDIILVGP